MVSDETATVSAWTKEPMTAPDLFSACIPRDDVLRGVLSDAVFAASLDEVVHGTAPDAYGDARRFFASTYPSQGLKELLNLVFGRVGGGRPAAPPVIRLETNLGGGKTHNLIALWHAAHGHLSPMEAVAFMDPELLPERPVGRVAVAVGTAAGATSFPAVDGVEARTLWEHLALQLAGPAAAHDLVGEAPLVAPGTAGIKKVLGDRPAIILIDELARYLATAAGQPVGETTLARQTVSFVMALMEAVDAKPNVSLVITTTEVTDAFGDETQALLDAMSEARMLMARREHVVRPSAETDLPRILARRLFEHVDERAGTEVGSAYARAAADAFARGADLPVDVHGGTFADQVASTYPFHPALVRVLDKRLSTIPNFQRTRGALRLLAGTVRLLWERRPAGTLLVHPHHLDLTDPHTVEELTSRLGLGTFEPVVRADIAGQPGGEPSHADEIDQRLGGRPGRRLASAIYLHSLTNDVPGIPAPELLGTVLAPGDDPNVLTHALEALEQGCWYLHLDQRGYRFSTEKSLVKVIQDAVQRTPLGKVRAEATEILGRVYKDAALKVRRTWDDARVPDREDDAALVLLHWDDFGDARGVDPAGPVPDRVRELWEQTPSGGLRQFRNRLVFLAPSLGTHDQMVATVRRHLALTGLAGDQAVLRDLPEEKRTELRNLAKESELLARVAVCNHVNVLYVPQASGLEAVELSAVTQASARPNQTDAVVDRLAAMDKTLAAGDPPLDPMRIRQRLGAMLDKPLATADLARAFAQRSDMKLVLDRQQLVTLVRAGVANGAWEYQDASLGDAGWATADRPPGSVRLGDDTFLHPLGSAPPITPVACPLCGEVHTGPCKGSPPVEPVAATAIEQRGAASTALAAALQEVADRKSPGVARLTIAVEEDGPEAQQQLARLQSLVPSGGAAEVTLEVTIRAALASPGHSLSLGFIGTPREWTPLRPAVDNVLRSTDAAVTARVTIDAGDGVLVDDVVASLTQRAAQTGPARCRVVITPKAG